MCRVLHKFLVEFDLAAKLFAVTTDGAPANAKMLRLLGEKISSQNRFFGEQRQVRCMAHIVHLVVQVGLLKLQVRRKGDAGHVVEEDEEEVRETLAAPPTVDIFDYDLGEAVRRVRSVVNTIRNSPTRAQQYREMCDSMGLPEKNKLPTDCPTRWNSTCRMIDVAWTKRRCLQSMAAMIDPRGRHHIDDEDWQMLREYCDVLEPFALISDTVCSTSYLPAPLVVGFFTLMLDHLDNSIQRFEDGGMELSFSRRMALVSACRKMRAKAKDYQEIVSSNLTMNIACALHPDVKLNAVPEDHRSLVLERLRDMTKDARDTLARDPPPTTSASSGSRIVTRESLLDAARRIYLPSATPSSSLAGAIAQSLDEISEYISGTFISTENVLLWWRDVGSRKFPALASSPEDSSHSVTPARQPSVCSLRVEQS